MNPYGIPHTALNRARLPIPPPRLKVIFIIILKLVKGDWVLSCLNLTFTTFILVYRKKGGVYVPWCSDEDP